MNKHSLKIFIAGIVVSFTLLTLSSCSDNWDAHYNTDPIISSDLSIWDQIKNNSNLSDFKTVLENTHLYNHNNLSTVSYADYLNSNQSFTVWAPINGSFNKDSLLSLCESPSGDSIVESAFLKNHIARYPFSVIESTNQNILMLNFKVKKLIGLTFGGVPISTPNITARNGILHVVDRNIPYYYNVYDGICNDPETSLLGKFMKSHQKDSLDEIASVASGIVDGKTVYVDSVMIATNLLLSELGSLNNEDSSYWMVAPTDVAWTEAYNRIAPYFNFSFISGASSLKDYWTNHTLINDAIFNPNEQKSIQDSLISTPYNAFYNAYYDVKYHVFHKPFDSGGILSNIKSNVFCSNGYIFKVDTWPFKLQEVFFHPIKVEAERDLSVSYTLSTLNVQTAIADSISNNQYIQLVPDKASSNPTITFEIPNTLSGKYDICIVCVPRSVFAPSTNQADSLKNSLPYKFKATLSYANEAGVSKSLNCPNPTVIDPKNLTFSNNPYKMDTVCVAKGFKFPTCNFNQDAVTVSLKISCFITSLEAKTFSREMFFDCIYLKPNED